MNKKTINNEFISKIHPHLIVFFLPSQIDNRTLNERISN
jgi:hypothetical protein